MSNSIPHARTGRQTGSQTAGLPRSRRTIAGRILPAAVSVLLGIGAILAPGIPGAPDAMAQILFKDGRLVDERPERAPPAPEPALTIPPGGTVIPRDTPEIVAEQLSGITLGYLPLLTSTPLHVMRGTRVDRKYGFRALPRRMASHGRLLQRIGQGRLDGGYVDLGLAILAYAQGLPIAVVASNSYNSTHLVARAKLADLTSQMAGNETPGIGAIRNFIPVLQEKLILLTPETNSLPHLVLDDWLTRLGIPIAETQVKGVGPGRMWRLLRSDRVDGAFATEPFLSALRKHDPKSRVILQNRQIFPLMPADVLVLRRDLIRERRADVIALLRAQRESVNLVQSNPTGVAPYAFPASSWSSLDRADIARILASPSIAFTWHPKDAAEAALTAHNLLVERGALRRQVSLADLFNTDLFDSVDTAPPPAPVAGAVPQQPERISLR